MLDCLNESQPIVTRKEHPCWGCDEMFPKGSKMYTSTYVHDECYTLWACPVCQAVLRHPDWEHDDAIAVSTLQFNEPELWANIDPKEAEATWLKDYREYRAALKKRRAECDTDRYEAKRDRYVKEALSE